MQCGDGITQSSYQATKSKWPRGDSLQPEELRPVLHDADPRAHDGPFRLLTMAGLRRLFVAFPSLGRGPAEPFSHCAAGALKIKARDRGRERLGPARAGGVALAANLRNGGGFPFVLTHERRKNDPSHERYVLR